MFRSFIRPIVFRHEPVFARIHQWLLVVFKEMFLAEWAEPSLDDGLKRLGIVFALNDF